MLEQLTNILNQHGNAFHQQIPRYRQNRYAQIVVLRETKSHAIFTTEGQTLDVERLQAGITNRKQIDRVVMYKRKQIAPERRTGKALLRDMDILTDIVVGKDNKGKNIILKRSECQIMGNSCGHCPDCILYGYAATKDTGSQRARVLTDSGFVLPQIFIPTVETLLDVTSTEFTYVLGNILKTTRYGAESNREGFIRNHVLGIYFSDVELFSNLELTQRYYDFIAQQEGGNLPDNLRLDQFVDNWPRVEQASLVQIVGRRSKVEDLDGLLSGVRELYESDTLLSNMLSELDKEALRYEKDVKSKDKDKASENNGEDAEA